MKISGLFFTLVIVSCVTRTGQKTTSEWVGLQNAGEAKCESWPMAEKDLEVIDLIPVTGDGVKSGIIGSIKQRNSSVQTVYIPFHKSFTFNTDEATILPIAHSSVALAAWETKGSSTIALVGHRMGDRSTLELRSVTDNRVLTKAQFVLDGELTGATYAIDGKEIWVTLKSGDYTSQFVKVTLAGAASKIEKIPHTSNVRGAQVVVDTQTHSPFLLEPIVEGAKLVIKTRGIAYKDFSIKASSTVEINANGGVESWAVASTEGGVYLAGIFGNSMIGQAELFQGFIGLKGGRSEVLWTKLDPLPDLHVSEPVLAAGTKTAFASLVKWVDGEATVGIYEFSKLSAKFKGDFGVLAKGSVVMSLFMIGPNTLGMVLRQKIKDVWRYNICQVKA